MAIPLFGRFAVRRGFRAAGILLATAMLSHAFIARSSIFIDASSVFTAPSSADADRAPETAAPRRGKPSRSSAGSPAAGREPVASAADDSPTLSGPGYSSSVLALEAAAVLPCPCTVPPPLQP